MSSADSVVVRPQGRLDAVRAPALEQQLREYLAQGKIHLIVDLGATSYISSNGLRVLLVALKAAEHRRGSLRLCCLSPRLEEIFEMVGFDQVFQIYQDRTSAEQALGGPGEQVAG